MSLMEERSVCLVPLIKWRGMLDYIYHLKSGKQMLVVSRFEPNAFHAYDLCLKGTPCILASGTRYRKADDSGFCMYIVWSCHALSTMSLHQPMGNVSSDNAGATVDRRAISSREYHGF